MASKGWIKVHRQLQDCDLWIDEEPFDRRSAWIDLLLSANHKDKQMIFNNHPIVIKKGQLLTSVRKLATRWHWGIHRTYNFLNLLIELGMIEKDSDSSRTLINIVNYSVFQEISDDVGNTIDNSNSNTTDNSTDNSQGTLSAHKQECKELKNVKNVKNERNKTIESAVYFDDAELNQAFIDFIKMRKSIKKPLTERAIQLQIKKLHELADMPFSDTLIVGDAIAIINQSIMNGWQSFYPLKTETKQGSSNQRDLLKELSEV